MEIASIRTGTSGENFRIKTDVNRTELRSAAFRAAVGLLQSARDPEHLSTHVFRLLQVVDGTPLARSSFEALALDSHHIKIAAERYQPAWPEAEQRRRMPPDSLGACLQRRFDAEGLTDLPPSSNQGDQSWQYLAERLRRTHDLHHLILGVPDSTAGEMVTASFYACRYRNAGAVAVVGAWMTHGLLQPEDHDLIWRALRFGITLAQDWHQPLLAVRWEENWERSVPAWRDLLGLTPFLESSPFPKERDAWLATSPIPAA